MRTIGAVAPGPGAGACYGTLRLRDISMGAKRQRIVGALLPTAALALWQCSGVAPVRIIGGGLEDSTTGSSSGESSSGPSNGSGSNSGSGSGSGSDMPEAGDMDAGFGSPDGGDDGTIEAGPCIGPDGGARCTPGVVACGGDGGACATSTSACCQANPPEGGTCQPSSAACPSGQSKIQCEEAADCPSGNVCCELFPAYATLGPTTCMASCPMDQSQICRTHAECAAGDAGPAKCLLQTCGSTAFGGKSVTLEACAVTATATGALPYCMPN